MLQTTFSIIFCHIGYWIALNIKPQLFNLKTVMVSAILTSQDTPSMNELLQACSSDDLSQLQILLARATHTKTA